MDVQGLGLKFEKVFRISKKKLIRNGTFSDFYFTKKTSVWGTR